MLKRCSKCGFEKDISNFHRKKASRDGYQCHCKKCVLKCRKEYYKDNIEKCRAYEREYRETTNGKILYARADKKYQQTEKGKIVRARALKKYERTEKGKMAKKRKSHRQRDCIKSTEVTLTLEQWNGVIRMQGNRCNICKQKFTKRRPPTIDHIIPLSKGGGSTSDNAQALCRSCNSSKNAKLDLEFIQTWSHRQ